MEARMNLIVLMPFYNEEQQIPLTVDRMIPLLDPLNIDYSLLLLDDGSTDRTWEAISSATESHPERFADFGFREISARKPPSAPGSTQRTLTLLFLWTVTCSILRNASPRC